MSPYSITKDTPVNNETLNLIARMPTQTLPANIEAAFFEKLSNKDFMRIATMLAQKSYDEGGCPIGGVIIDSKTRQILGKGHNMLVQENDPTIHGETAAIRDAGRVAMLEGKGVDGLDFRGATMFTTLTPCEVCCAQLCKREHFDKVVIGDITNAPSTEPILRAGGVTNIQILQDPEAIALYKEYSIKHPDLHFIDWGGHKKFDEAKAAGEVSKAFLAAQAKNKDKYNAR